MMPSVGKADGAIAKSLAKVLNMKNMTNGISAPSIEVASLGESMGTPDFSALLGDSGGHGRYSVADISGGGNLTPIGPAMGGGNYIA